MFDNVTVLSVNRDGTYNIFSNGVFTPSVQAHRIPAHQRTRPTGTPSFKPKKQITVSRQQPSFIASSFAVCNGDSVGTPFNTTFPDFIGDTVIDQLNPYYSSDYLLDSLISIYMVSPVPAGLQYVVPYEGVENVKVDFEFCNTNLRTTFELFLLNTISVFLPFITVTQFNDFAHAFDAAKQSGANTWNYRAELPIELKALVRERVYQLYSLDSADVVRGGEVIVRDSGIVFTPPVCPHPTGTVFDIDLSGLPSTLILGSDYLIPFKFCGRGVWDRDPSVGASLKGFNFEMVVTFPSGFKDRTTVYPYVDSLNPTDPNGETLGYLRLNLADDSGFYVAARPTFADNAFYHSLTGVPVLPTTAEASFVIEVGDNLDFLTTKISSNRVFFQIAGRASGTAPSPPTPGIPTQVSDRVGRDSEETSSTWFVGERRYVTFGIQQEYQKVYVASLLVTLPDASVVELGSFSLGFVSRESTQARVLSAILPDNPSIPTILSTDTVSVVVKIQNVTDNVTELSGPITIPVARKP